MSTAAVQRCSPGLQPRGPLPRQWGLASVGAGGRGPGGGTWGHDSPLCVSAGTRTRQRGRRPRPSWGDGHLGTEALRGEGSSKIGVRESRNLKPSPNRLQESHFSPEASSPLNHESLCGFSEETRGALSAMPDTAGVGGSGQHAAVTTVTVTIEGRRTQGHPVQRHPVHGDGVGSTRGLLRVFGHLWGRAVGCCPSWWTGPPPQPVTSSPSRGSLIWGRRCRGLLASHPTPVCFLGTSQRCLGEGREVGVTWGGSVCHPPPSSSPADPGSPTLPQGPPVEVHHVPDDQLRL